jgi:hypothetical protein
MRGIDQGLRAITLLGGILGVQVAEFACGHKPKFTGIDIAPAAHFPQVTQFACGRDDIVGRRPGVGSSELPDAACQKRHWSRSSTMINSFASP